MRLLFLVLVLLAPARVVTAYPSCDDVSRLQRPVTEIEITNSYSDRSGASGSRSLSRISYSADQRMVSIATTSIKPSWKQTVECRYDKKRRLVREAITEYDGRDIVERTTTSYEYSDRVSIATSGGKKTYLYHDTIGRVIRGMARGPGNRHEDIEYKYFDNRVEVRSMWSNIDVFGERLQVFDVRGNLTRFETNGGTFIDVWTYDEFDELGNWISRARASVVDGSPSSATEVRQIRYR